MPFTAAFGASGKRGTGGRRMRLLSVQGAREEEHQAAHPYGGHHLAGEANSAFAVACSAPGAE